MQKNNDKNLEKTVDNIDVFDEKNGVQEGERDVDNAQIVRLDDDCDEKTSTMSTKRKRVVFLPTTLRVKAKAKSLLRL